jgi:hypothetical protein
VESDIVSGERISKFIRYDFPSESLITTQQSALRHCLEDLHIKPSDLFKHLAEEDSTRKTLLIFVMEVSGSNSRLRIYSPN